MSTSANSQPSAFGDLDLHVPGHVAEADDAQRGVAAQQLGDQAGRVREVDERRVRCAALDLARDREHHGDRAQRLGEAADAGRLLPDQPERAARQLVAVPRLLSADAQLRDDERRARERVGRVRRPAHLQVRAGGLAHAAREAPDDLEPLVVGIEQHELGRGQPIAPPQDSVDELRGVGGAAAYDADLHEAGAYAYDRRLVRGMALEPHLVVSTHFDDAALSLAHVLQSAGALATVVTVCGGAPPSGAPVERLGRRAGFATAAEAARVRRARRRRACAVTGARAHPPAPPRRPLRPGRLRAGRPARRDRARSCRTTASSGSPPASATRTTPTCARLCCRSPRASAGARRAPTPTSHTQANDEVPERLRGAPDRSPPSSCKLDRSALPRIPAAHSLQEAWPDLLERHGPLSRERYV